MSAPLLLNLEMEKMENNFYNNILFINKIYLSFNFSHMNLHIFHRIMFFVQYIP